MAVLIRSRLAALLGLATLTTAGCDGVVVDLRDDLYGVHSLLIAGSDSAVVRVTNNDPRLQFPAIGVEDAVVRLLGGADTLELIGLPAPVAVSGGWYGASIPAGVGPGQRYELVVDLPDGSRARGSARILRPPVIRSPGAGNRIILEGPTLTPVDLEAPSAAASGTLSAQFETLFRNGLSVEGADCTFGSPDPEAQPPKTIQEMDEVTIPLPSCRDGDGPIVSWDSMTIWLKAVVYDSVYTRYARTTFGAEAVYLEYASQGITGAVGFFASGAEAAVPLRLVNSGEAASTRSER